MLELMLSTLLAVYIGVAVLLSVVWAIAIIKYGGFQTFTDECNRRGGTKATSNQTQWMFVAITLFWPTLPFFIKLGNKALDRK